MSKFPHGIGRQARYILDALPDAALITDTDGRIQFINRRAEALFDYDREALLQQPVERLSPARFQATVCLHRARYAAHPDRRPWDVALPLVGMRQDGAEFPMEVRLSPLTLAGASLVLSIIRAASPVASRNGDASNQQQAEQVEREARPVLDQRGKQRVAEQRLEMLHALFNELPSGVYLAYGPEARLALANPQVTRLLGASWMEGQPLAECLAAGGVQVFDPQGRELPVERLATIRALRTGQSTRQQEAMIRHRDGSEVWVLANAIAVDPALFPPLRGMTTTSDLIRNPAPGQASGLELERELRPGSIPLVLVVQQDISALKQAERIKDEFVALAAHELRNPIAVLTTYVDLVDRMQRSGQGSSQRSGVDAESIQSMQSQTWQDDATRIVRETSEALSALTDDLLDATRLQANLLTLYPEPYDLGTLVRRVVLRMQATSDKHQVTVTIPKQPIVVEVDARRMEQVVTNLLSNAIKYSPAGGPIEVTLAVQPAPSLDPAQAAYSLDPVHAPSDVERRLGVARLTIRDQGIGIPASHQPQLFERFSRADNARVLGITGTGLGLYLCRELVERQGGQIGCASAEGQGSTFTVELPLWTEGTR